MIVFEHTVPFLLLVVLVLLAAGAGGYSAWRYLQIKPGTIAITALYAATLAGLFWCLLLPGCKDVSTHLIKPRFIVALDTSQSMMVVPGEGVETRWERARRVLEMPWVEALSAEAQIDVYPFASETGGRMAPAATAALTAEGTSTLLRDALRDLAGRHVGLNVAGLLLLSDGNDTREAFDDWATDPQPFPIHTVRLEDDALWTQEPDLRVDTVITPQRVTVGWQTELKAVVSGRGTQGRPVSVQLFREGVLIDEKPTQIPADGGQREVVFTLSNPEVGMFAYRVYVVPLEGEKQLADNEYSLTVAVQDPRNRLLYVEGVPRFEYRFLRRVLMSSELITPSVFYSTADGTARSGSPASGVTADMTESDLLQFKIVILGNLGAEELTETRAANLVRFVEEGGSLVLLGGSRGWGNDGFMRTSLRKLLPTQSLGTQVLEGSTPFETSLTPLALAHPAFAGDDAFWAVMPPILSVFPDAVAKPGAEVLVTAETPQGSQPVVMTQRYGQGRVAAILTDSLWRWQLTAETTQQPYSRFWTQLLSWLLPDLNEQDQNRLDLFADHDQIHIGEAIVFSSRLPDAARLPDETRAGDVPNVRITGPDGRTVPFAMTPGQIAMPDGRSFTGFQLRYEPAEPGAYQAEAVLGSDTDGLKSEPVMFNVRAYSPETAPRPIRVDLLRTLAKSSGGWYFNDVEELDRALGNLQVSVIEEERSDFKSLWQRWMVLVPLMGLAASMWVLRKRLNMP